MTYHQVYKLENGQVHHCFNSNLKQFQKKILAWNNQLIVVYQKPQRKLREITYRIFLFLQTPISSNREPLEQFEIHTLRNRYSNLTSLLNLFKTSQSYFKRAEQQKDNDMPKPLMNDLNYHQPEKEKNFNKFDFFSTFRSL